RPGTSWLVVAGPFQIAVTGTRFDVRWGDEPGGLEVKMLEGTVIVRGALAGRGPPLRAGQPLGPDPAPRLPPRRPPPRPRGAAPRRAARRGGGGGGPRPGGRWPGPPRPRGGRPPRPPGAGGAARPATRPAPPRRPRAPRPARPRSTPPSAGRIASWS